MPTPLIPQEVYLLERYSSPEYFAPMRDQWEAMVKHVERCLEVFMENLSPDYRRRGLPDQPDIAWGERVLPNFRSTQHNLYRAYINLSHGDFSALQAAWGVTGGHRGQAEYWAGWMDEPHVAAVIPNAQDIYYQLLSAPLLRASNIVNTLERSWAKGDLSFNYSDDDFGPLEPPESWPRYRINPAIRSEPDGTVPRSGIYLPDIERSCAALLIEGRNTSRAQYLLRVEDRHDPNGNKYAEDFITERRTTGWTLIEQVPGESIPLEEGLGSVESRPQRVPAGETCPRSGWWHTPAKADSRRFIQKGEMLPKIEGSDYGDTFWLWSPNQSDPKL